MLPRRVTRVVPAPPPKAPTLPPVPPVPPPKIPAPLPEDVVPPPEAGANPTVPAVVRRAQIYKTEWAGMQANRDQRRGQKRQATFSSSQQQRRPQRYKSHPPDTIGGSVHDLGSSSQEYHNSLHSSREYRSSLHSSNDSRFYH
ncbi:uncharacterized protein LOC131225582 [Magnolia sinica]|uniref:uncharacterized protein LOC131225582 n=1 Tax=Magnolia sinica TaxID=86752 RepID=UPI00265A4285|nr:uncharacterized protein LOC131225582 [Magnolia sinica]